MGPRADHARLPAGRAAGASYPAYFIAIEPTGKRLSGEFSTIEQAREVATWVRLRVPHARIFRRLVLFEEVA
jgi:hypothetical protein